MVKIFIFAISLMCSIFAMSGVNFERIIKKGYVWEARFLYIIIILCMSSILSNFVYNVLELFNL